MFFFYENTNYRIVDVGKKYSSYRRACVVGSIFVGKDVFNLIKNNRIEKGDPLLLSEIAGINAVKKTSSIILLCHQIFIENVLFNLVMDDKNYIIWIYCLVFAHAKTGVEMEAMCGTSIALLSIYDLVKKYNPFILIKDIKLLFKDGGENGLVLGSLNDVPNHLKNFFLDDKNFLENFSVILVTVSNRASVGYYFDLSGQILFDYFFLKKSFILYYIIIPDKKELLSNILLNLVIKYDPNFIIISGGTGVSSDDISFDVLTNICDKMIPGISELLRYNGSFYSKNSFLSNSSAGIFKKSVLISLPGNPSAVIESLNILKNFLLHIIKIIRL